MFNRTIRIAPGNELFHRRTLFGGHRLSAEVRHGDTRISLSCWRSLCRRGTYNLIVEPKADTEEKRGQGPKNRPAVSHYSLRGERRAESNRIMMGDLDEVCTDVHSSQCSAVASLKTEIISLLKEAATFLGEKSPHLEQ
jgi:hypothetical protein